MNIATYEYNAMRFWIKNIVEKKIKPAVKPARIFLKLLTYTAIRATSKITLISENTAAV
jgi:hypothetical protein